MKVKAAADGRLVGGRAAAAKVGGRRVAKRARRAPRAPHAPVPVTATEFAFGSPLASLNPESMGFDMETANEQVDKASFGQVKRSQRFQVVGMKAAQRRPDGNSTMRRQGRVMQPGGASCAQRREV